MKTSRGSVAAVVSLVVTMLVFATAAWVILNRQLVADQIVVWRYTPPQNIAQLADSAHMSETGRFYFYASDPQLEGTSKFNDACQRKEEHSAILGCYRNGKIYVYDVKDKRLNGVEEVTAAHEMLHAAYERLGNSEKTRINGLLEQEYKKLMSSGDTALQERMQYYERTEPGERDNELHSILATEVESLPSDLEEYFRRYFDDRQAVVKLHGSYNDKFTELRSSSEQLKTQLDVLADDIDALTNQYNETIRLLNNDIARFNTRAEGGDFANEAEFQAARSALVARVDTEARARESINTKVADYESKRKAYNATVDESNSLTRSLDSSLAPAPSI